jgi:hypothetical protein
MFHDPHPPILYFLFLLFCWLFCWLRDQENRCYWCSQSVCAYTHTPTVCVYSLSVSHSLSLSLSHTHTLTHSLTHTHTHTHTHSLVCIHFHLKWFPLLRGFRQGFCSFSIKTVSVRFEFFQICEMVLLRGDGVVNYIKNHSVVGLTWVTITQPSQNYIHR